MKLHAPPDFAPPAEQGWRAALTRTAPIILGYLPVGLAYGVLAREAGLSACNALAMSLLVFAGSAQLIAVSLFSLSAPAVSVIVTTLAVNARHLLFSAALAPYLGRWSRGRLALLAFELTDETFALHAARMGRDPEANPEAAEVFRVNVLAQGAWVCGTGLGIVVGQGLGDIKPLGLDFALPAMFIALLAGQVRDRAGLAAAAAAGVAGVALSLAGLTRSGPLLAALLGALTGMGVEAWTSKRSS